MVQFSFLRVIFAFAVFQFSNVGLLIAGAEGGRTGVGGGFFDVQRTRSILKDVLLVYAQNSSKEDDLLLPKENVESTLKLLNEKRTSISISLQKSIYLKIEKEDRSKVSLISHDQYAHLLLSSDSSVFVKEVPIYILSEQGSEASKKVLLSKTLWKAMSSENRIALLFSVGAQLSGVHAARAKKLGNEFLDWLEEHKEAEEYLTQLVGD